MAEDFVKIFGIERSGTVFTQRLITLNIPGTLAMSNGFGWKHGEVQDPQWWLDNHRESSDFFKSIYEQKKETGIPAVIVIKNPYSWYNSIKRYAARFKGYQPFDDKWQYERFNRLYLHWHEELLTKENKWYTSALIIRYEDLLIDPRPQIQRVADLIGKEVTQEMVIPDTVEMSATFNEKRRKKYLDVEKLDGEKTYLVNTTLDPKIWSIFGYNKIIKKP